MPYNIGNTINYNAAPTPNVADSYSWSLSGGGFINGSATNSSVSVTWTSAGNHSVFLTVTNSCSTRSTQFDICVQDWVEFSPQTIKCGADSEVQLDPCNQYIKEIETCTGNIRWTFYSANSSCGGCSATFANTVAGYHESTVVYYKTCPVGCTPVPFVYTATSSVPVGTVFANSVAQANQNAQDQAVANVNSEQANNGQNAANAIPDEDACDCPCTPVWTNTTDIVCGASIPSGDPVVGNSVATCWEYVKQTNQCNSDIQWVEYQQNICGCPSCLYTPIYSDVPGSEYCNGPDCMINQVDQCGNAASPRLVQANCAACACVPNWQAIVGSNTCGQDVANHPTHPQSGLDPCGLYLREEDGCGNSRWTYAFQATGCPGCCIPPTVSSTGMAYSSVIGVNGLGQRVIALGNYSPETINVSINLVGNITSTTIPPNMAPGTTFDWVLPSVWIYNPGDVGELTFWFDSDPQTCNFIGYSTVI
jgi:hypothetical protein